MILNTAKALTLGTALCGAISCTQHHQLSEIQQLNDPIVEKIPKGDLLIGLQDFVRLPKTTDSSNNLTNAAYARIQYMVPFGYTVGPLVINDTRGLLYKTDERGGEPKVYLDLRTADVGFDDSQFPNEMGLSSVAFHPEFTSIGKPGFGKFYTAYSARSDSGTANYLDDDAGSHESVIREWTTLNPRADVFEGQSREIFRIGQFAPNHNIGTIAFNPLAEVGSADYGVLYASLGDGGAANDPRENGQSLAAPLSTIMRIIPLASSADHAYSIPEDNPFVAREAEGIAPEIWAYGLRHAQQFSWDSSGRMFICDIGQNQVEEVNIGQAGANYGWRLREGSFATAFSVAEGTPGAVYAKPKNPAEFVLPVAQYDHDEGNAIGGGYLYEGNAIPELRGKFLFTDIVRGRIFYFDASETIPGIFKNIKELRVYYKGEETNYSEIASIENTYQTGARVDLRFGVDALGELYLLSKADGWVRKLVPLQ